MIFLPTENITYKTKLSEKEVISRLSEIIERKETLIFWGFGSGSTKAYEGKINNQTFSIKRIIGYRNSFLPTINGIIEKDYDGTTIKVKMRLHIFVLIFLCIWCGFAGFACITFLMRAFDDSKLDPSALIPFGMLLFAYVLATGGFKFESYKSKKDLRAIFQADIIKE